MASTQTSGSVVLNSMTLLTADGSIAQNQVVQNSTQDTSSVPAALTVDGSGQSPDISTASGSRAAEQNRGGTSTADGQIARDDVAAELTGSGQDDDMWNMTQRFSEQVKIENGIDGGGDGKASCAVVGSGGDSACARQPSGTGPTELADVTTAQGGGGGTGCLLVADSVSAGGREPLAEKEILLACSNDARAGVVPVVQDDFFSSMSTSVVDETERAISTINDAGLFPKIECIDRTIDVECRVEQREVSLSDTRSASTANEHRAGEAGNISERDPTTEPVKALNVEATAYESTKDTGKKKNKAEFALPWSDRESADSRAVMASRVVDGKVEDASPKATSEQHSFLPSCTFTRGNPGYVFKLGDRGLGFYVDGYVDRVAKESRVRAPRAWNAGPGDDAFRRGPIGPIRKPFRKITALRRRKDEQVHAAEESDARPFMARMVAQRNSRGFQSTLLDREHVLDAHILSLLDLFNDPSVFKKRHGYNVHGQMLGKDGKMIVKPHMEKTEEEKAKLSWYRKVYEDRLGKHLPSKRLGDSIEARREAYAYSRYFTAELDGRQKQLNDSLQNALKGVTKLEFITEDYHFPGAYNTDGKVILEKGAPASNELHQTEEQKERACSFRFKAIQRYRAAHDDIVSATSKKDKALQKLFKKTDPFLLQEIAQEAVESSGTGIYRQKKRDGRAGVEPEANSSRTIAGGQTRSPEQLRDAFSRTLKAQIKDKDKTLLKEVAALADKDTDQMIDDFGKGAEIFPHSWRQDPTNIRHMERRRKELITEFEADRCKIVCPWRPGGLHIAQEPWQPFLPRSHGPAQTASSRGVANDVQGAATIGNGERTSIRGAAGTAGCSSDNKGTVPLQPHMAPTPRRKEFIDRISVRARRILAAQSPSTPLHTAFSVYSNDPYPLESIQQSHRGPGDSATGRAAGDFSPPRSPGVDCWAEVGEGRKCAWAELSGSLNIAIRSHTPTMKVRKETPRPHSAAPDAPQRICTPKRRPLTACGIRRPDSVNVESVCCPTDVGASECDSPSSPGGVQTNEKKDGVKSLDLRVQSKASVTVLWARLCKPSDIVYKSAAWPSRPGAAAYPRPERRRRRAPRNAALSAGLVLATRPSDRNKHSDTAHGGEPPFATNESDHVKKGDESKANEKRASSVPLHVLEQNLSDSSWRRVNERRRVFRGYSDRSRRQQTWDPGSVFYADGAGHHRSGMRAGGVGKGRGGERAVGSHTREGIVGDVERDSCHRRRPGSLDVEGPVVDMHWNEVDTKRFSEAAEEMRAKLEGKLFAAVANDEGGASLDECFREARELVDASGQLLGWPHILRGRLKQNLGGDCRIGNYVSTVSRLSHLWTATCGVVVILDMMRRREKLVKEFLGTCSSNDTTSTCTNGPGLGTTEAADKKSLAEDPGAVTGPHRDDRIKAFENRLEIAEYSIAIAESLKSWTAYTPWRVRVLWQGEDMLSMLGAEEESMPWPPEPGQDPDHVTHVQLEKYTDTDTTDELVSFGPQALETSGSDTDGGEGSVVLVGQSADDSEVVAEEGNR